MSKYVMLECNRLNGRKQYGGIDENQDVYKNKWTNNVNSTGITVNAGDTITCEASAINTVGAADSCLEYLGEENKNGYLDNKCSLSMAYYVNDSGFNMVKLPLQNTHTSFGYRDRSDGAGELRPWTFYMGDGVGGDSPLCLDLLKSRSCGEVYFDEGYLKGAVVDGITPDLRFELPKTGLVYNLKLDKNNLGKNYRIGGTYEMDSMGGNQTDPTKPEYIGAITSKMSVDVLDVITETGQADMPSKIRIRDPGVGYDLTKCPFNLQIGNAIDGGSGPGAGFQQVIIDSYMDVNFASKCTAAPDGRRYYFGQIGWSGIPIQQYVGEPQDLSQGRDFGSLQPDFEYRQTDIDIQVPIGLSTPDNISTLITDQLHAPTRMTVERSRDSKSGMNIDYESAYVESVLADDSFNEVRPPMITTPTWDVFPAGNSYVQQDRRMNSLVGARRQYYSVLGIDNPDKFYGLQHTRQFYYGLTNSIPENQINSGLNQVANRGDFENQEIGNHGLNQCVMMVIPHDPDETAFSKLNQGDWVLTNTYFTEENIQNIAEGFRRGERYFDDLNVVLDPHSAEYKKGLGVAMDLGMYIDEISNAYPLTPSDDQSRVPFIPNQRARFHTQWEVQEGDQAKRVGWKYVDFGNGVDAGGTKLNDDFCRGSIPWGAFTHRDGRAENDGQELSSLVITSRYDGDTIFNDSNIQDNYQRLYDAISPGGNLFGFTVNGQSIRDTFIRTYTDDLAQIGTKSTADLMAMAKRYDVACIPVFPKAGTEFYKNGGRPYIAYKSHYNVGFNTGYASLDTSNPTRTGFKWSIDSRNCPYGIQMGLDLSSIRNNLALCYNTNFASPSQLSDPKAYCPMLYMGAVNPTLNFNSIMSRFEWSGWNTPLTIGNGSPGSNQYNLDATGNPEQQCYSVNIPGTINDHVPGNAGTPPILTTPAATIRNRVTRGVCFWNQSNSESFIESLSGLSFMKLKLYDGNDNEYVFNYNGVLDIGVPYDTSSNYFTYWNDDDIGDTMFGKMGFTMRQFLPLIGRNNAQFTNPLTFRTTYGSLRNELLRTPYPMTTGAYISSAEYQPTGTNALDMPLYNLYPNMGLPSQPAVEQGVISAFNLPSKLDYPYMLIYSSILADGTDTEYYGGLDGKSKLPCIGFITRNYNDGDFFYSLEQGFSYTANKNFVITDIETELRLPNGLRPRLQPHSSVIYKITKPLGFPLPQQQPPSPTSRKKRVPHEDAS
tara:strand:- start:940 stop:4599 length:3660 start_codon:yes stop_codon:yes gene_type:complete